jgi:hypothetical protein
MGWTQLQQRFPWPDVRPDIRPHVHGWTVHEQVWTDLLGDLWLPIVAEVGAWTGKTSRWLLGKFPKLRLIAVDQWNQDYPEYVQLWRGRFVAEGRMRPTDQMADLYLTNLWDYRDRVVVIRAESCPGMRAIADCGVRPCVVYIDADHTYEHVRPDLETALDCFPDSLICGDDYNPKSGVGQAVHEIADERGFRVEALGNKRFWRYVR